MRTFVAFIILALLAAQGALSAYPGRPGMPAARGDQEALAQPSLAEQYLFRLSDKMRKRRKVAGTAGLAVGVAGVAGGLAMIGADEEDDLLGFARLFGAYFVAAGAASLGAGVLSLSVKSRAERADARVRAVSDAAEREMAAAAALADLAAKARKARMIQGGAGIALGALAFVLSEDPSGGLSMGATFGAMAAYSFLVKSPEEKAHRSFEERRDLRLAPDLVLGITPRGGVLAGLSLSF
jgi:hypothetical protein